MTAPDCATCGGDGDLNGICPDCLGVGWIRVLDADDERALIEAALELAAN